MKRDDHREELSLEESGLNITRLVATPAGKTLFEINEKEERLSAAAAEVFHSITAKLLYVSSIRARMDLLLATSFLTTPVSKSTQQDLNKLKRLLECIRGSIDDQGALRTWVDASYAVHPDYKVTQEAPCRLGQVSWYANPASRS